MAGKMPAPHKVGNLVAGYLDEAPSNVAYTLSNFAGLTIPQP
jgi:hypothetical protein